MTCRARGRPDRYRDGRRPRQIARQSSRRRGGLRRTFPRAAPPSRATSSPPSRARRLKILNTDCEGRMILRGRPDVDRPSEARTHHRRGHPDGSLRCARRPLQRPLHIRRCARVRPHQGRPRLARRRLAPARRSRVCKADEDACRRHRQSGDRAPTAAPPVPLPFSPSLRRTSAGRISTSRRQPTRRAETGIRRGAPCRCSCASF